MGKNLLWDPLCCIFYQNLQLKHFPRAPQAQLSLLCQSMGICTLKKSTILTIIPEYRGRNATFSRPRAPIIPVMPAYEALYSDYIPLVMLPSPDPIYPAVPVIPSPEALYIAPHPPSPFPDWVPIPPKGWGGKRAGVGVEYIPYYNPGI